MSRPEEKSPSPSLLRRVLISPITLGLAVLSRGFYALRPYAPTLIPILVCSLFIPLIILLSTFSGWYVWSSLSVSWQVPLYFQYGSVFEQVTVPAPHCLVVVQERHRAARRSAPPRHKHPAALSHIRKPRPARLGRQHRPRKLHDHAGAGHPREHVPRVRLQAGEHHDSSTPVRGPPLIDTTGDSTPCALVSVLL